MFDPNGTDNGFTDGDYDSDGDVDGDDLAIWEDSYGLHFSSWAAARNIERQATLALVLARYDQMRKLEKQIVAPILTYRQQQGSDVKSNFTDCRASIMAITLWAPEEAVAWAVAVEQATEGTKRRYIPQAWEIVLNTLTSDQEELGRTVTKEIYHQWVIGEYDF